MNISLKNRLFVTAVLALIVATQCYPAKTKKGGANHKRTVNRHKGHGKSNTKKDSVNQRFMGAMMNPGKLDMSDERQLDNFQDYNKAFMNPEMAAESSLLANQGIDDDSALKISNMAALPNRLEDHASSKKGMSGRIKGNPVAFNKPNVAGFQPDEYLLDANSWPEYRIKDSDYLNKNYRVFPQGGAYPGGYMGAMPYGQTAAAGMEGPYGDGNYGFPPAGAQHMVNDEQEQAREQEQEPEQDQGGAPSFQDEGPMAITPATNRIRHHRKMKNPANQNYGDQAQIPSDAHNAGGSGSGHNDAGSGSGSYDGAKVISISQDQGKGKTTEGAGKVTVDTKPDGTVVLAKTDSSSAGTPVKSEQTKTESKAQENTSPEKTQNEKSPSKGTEKAGSASDSKAPAGQQGKEEANSEAPPSTLGDFAKFLKSKGITLTINKESKDSGKENASPANPPQQASSPAGQSDASSPAGQSDASSILPSTGQPMADSAGNPTINISPEGNEGHQVPDRPLHQGVMRWQNINVVPQENQLGELFLRHKTKPHH